MMTLVAVCVLAAGCLRLNAAHPPTTAVSEAAVMRNLTPVAAAPGAVRLGGWLVCMGTPIFAGFLIVIATFVVIAVIVIVITGGGIALAGIRRGRGRLVTRHRLLSRAIV